MIGRVRYRTPKAHGVQGVGRHRRVTATVALSVATAGFIIFLLHTTEAAFTGHIWSLIGQGALIGGGF